MWLRMEKECMIAEYPADAMRRQINQESATNNKEMSCC